MNKQELYEQLKTLEQFDASHNGTKKRNLLMLEKH
jgi:hypothetical protein